LSQAIDKLNVFYTSERTHSTKVSLTSELKAQYLNFSSSLSQTTTKEDAAKTLRVLPVQPTAQRLAEFLGAIKCVWVIEDFHKVADIEKKRIADVLKIFMDSAREYPKVKIVCIGAVATARELMELDPNLSTRVAELFVPLLTNAELKMIVQSGFNLLNIRYRAELKDKIIYYSNNLASICHQICYDIAFNRSIERSRVIPVHIDEDDFKRAVIAYVRKNSDTFTKIFDKIVATEHRKHILEGLMNSQQESATWEELLHETNKIRKVDPTVFVRLLDELISVDCHEVLRFDRNSKKYYFSSPFFQAFLKMKLALEYAEKAERRQLRKKKRQFSLIERREEVFVFNDRVFEEMALELNEYYQRRLALQRRYEKVQQRGKQSNGHADKRTHS
jgi:hypothetical protein